MDWRAPTIQRSNHALNAAVEVVGDLVERPEFFMPLALEVDRQRAVQIGHLSETIGDGVEVIRDFLEDRAVGHPRYGRAGSLVIVIGSDPGIHLARGNAELIALGIDVAVSSNLDGHRLREGVHDRNADTVQAA